MRITLTLLLCAAVLAIIGWFLVLPRIEKLPTEVPNATSTSLEVKTYTNEKYHYTFSYPNDWVMEPETSIIDIVNNMPSIVSVHEPKAGQPERFTITINKDERLIKDKAEKKETITIGGTEVTAYLFPNGYGCEKDPDCSFFLVPIKHAGWWYEITAANHASTTDAYKEILASFKFTD